MTDIVSKENIRLYLELSEQMDSIKDLIKGKIDRIVDIISEVYNLDKLDWEFCDFDNGLSIEYYLDNRTFEICCKDSSFRAYRNRYIADGFPTEWLKLQDDEIKLFIKSNLTEAEKQEINRHKNDKESKRQRLETKELILSKLTKEERAILGV